MGYIKETKVKYYIDDNIYSGWWIDQKNIKLTGRWKVITDDINKVKKDFKIEVKYDRKVDKRVKVPFLYFFTKLEWVTEIEKDFITWIDCSAVRFIDIEIYECGED